MSTRPEGENGGVAHLLAPYQLGQAELRNRAVVSAMTQYSADDGHANDYHLVHLGRFALGGFGMVITECVSVAESGRSSWGDLGLWRDDQIADLARVARFLQANGAVAAAQLGHAGARAGRPRPWFRAGTRPGMAPEPAWPWAVRGPNELSLSDIDEIVAQFAASAERAWLAGFQVLELHMAHAYLLSQFLSPLLNRRSDAFGGDRAARARVPLMVVRAVRESVPATIPLIVKLSAVEAPGGTTIEDSVWFARVLRDEGVDLVDVSTTPYPGQELAFGYQVEWASRIRAGARVPTMAVGLITTPELADSIVREGRADLVAVGREALNDPQWALHAYERLSVQCTDELFDVWPLQAGHWLRARSAVLGALPVEGRVATS